MQTPSSAVSDHSLLAGTAEVDITPLLQTTLAGHFVPRTSDEIDSPLKSKAVVIDNSQTILAIVVLDLISIPIGEVRQIRANASQRTGIPEENIFISCTHTHTGPATRSSHSVKRDEQYCEWLIPKVADSIVLAWKRRKPARLAWGQGEQHDLIFCRRYRMLNGTVVMNPGRGNPEVVEPVSQVDPLVGVLYIEDEQRVPLAVVARYSLHYVGTDNNFAISSDYFGHFAKIMQKQLGEQCTVLLQNGNSGQINNVDVFDPQQPTGDRQSKLVAQALAGEVFKVISRLRPTGEVTLGACIESIRLSRKPITAHDLQVAHKILNTPEGQPTVANFDWLVGAPIPQRLHRYYASGVQAVADMPETFISEVQCLRIADAAWVGLPGEIFVETGEKIRESSPATETFVVGLANDSLGYFATDQAFQEGGYETWTSIGCPVAPSENILIHHSLSCIDKLFSTE